MDAHDVSERIMTLVREKPGTDVQVAETPYHGEVKVDILFPHRVLFLSVTIPREGGNISTHLQQTAIPDQDRVPGPEFSDLERLLYYLSLQLDAFDAEDRTHQPQRWCSIALFDVVPAPEGFDFVHLSFFPRGSIYVRHAPLFVAYEGELLSEPMRMDMEWGNPDQSTFFNHSHPRVFGNGWPDRQDLAREVWDVIRLRITSLGI